MHSEKVDHIMSASHGSLDRETGLDSVDAPNHVATPDGIDPKSSVTSGGAGRGTARAETEAVSGPLTSSDAAASDDGVVVTVVMPTVSWTGAFAACGRRILSLLDETDVPTEFIVVFDGPAPSTPMWLERADVRMLSTGRRSGPACARNLAARAARGRILFFVDADVELDPGAIERVTTTFEADPDLVGIFGAYDDEPAAEGAVSRFRNLLHHHTHTVHAGRADTFWSGCGALRTAEFIDVGGFDEDYALPSVEDIELGMRINAQQGRILLDPGLRCKHLKQWTFPSMLVADVFYRAKPWTHLIMETQHLPVTLNIDWKGRVSGVTSLVLTLSVICIPFQPRSVWVALAAAALLVGMNLGFYRLCLRKGGLRFAASSIALHCLYFLYSSLTFAVVVIQETFHGSHRPTTCHSRPSTPPPAEPATTSVAPTQATSSVALAQATSSVAPAQATSSIAIASQQAR
jgi:glycosyltransferase involved in cell wall biosynthesis